MSQAEEPKSARPTEELPTIDVAERAGQHTGNPQELHTRLFMQLQVFKFLLLLVIARTIKKKINLNRKV